MTGRRTNVQTPPDAWHDLGDMRRHAFLALTTAGLAAVAAGCGGSASNDKPSPAVSKPSGSYPAAGISFTPPSGWSTDSGTGKLVATVQAGQATVAVWRYPRSQRLPKSKAELKAARDALLAAEHQRDASFSEIKTAPTTIGGLPAVQIRARETIAGQPRTVRSTHIYAHGAEIIVDAYADTENFRQIDAQVFRPLLRSLQVAQPKA
jgi:hypothetical protein